MTGTSKLWTLELLRGGAAVAVVVCHFAIIFPELGRSELRNAISNWGITAVIIFFVLSGAVIRLSVERSGFASGSFLLRRGLRIVPLYMLALLVTVLVETAPVSSVQLAGHLTFTATLPGWIAPTFSSNPVLWSLSYEMGFYTLFALFRGTHRTGELAGCIVAVLAGLAVCLAVRLPAGLEHLKSVLAFYGVWLVGYFAIKWRGVMAVEAAPSLFVAACTPMIARSAVTGGYPDYGQSFLIALVLAPLLAGWVVRAQGSSVQARVMALPFLVYLASVGLFIARSQSRPHAAVLFAVFPLLVLAASAWVRTTQFSKRIIRFAGWLGLISYALYLFHYPVFVAVSRWAGTENLAAALAAVAAIFALAHLLESKIQPVVAGWLEQLYARSLSGTKSNGYRGLKN